MKARYHVRAHPAQEREAALFGDLSRSYSIAEWVAALAPTAAPDRAGPGTVQPSPDGGGR